MLSQKLILGYSSRVVSQVLSMAAGIVVARLAGPTVLGTVAFSMSFVSLFVFLADFGVGSAHVKLVSEGRPLGTCIATFRRLKLYLMVFYAVVVLFFILFQRFVFHSSFESDESLAVVLIWMASILVSQLTLIPGTSFMARMEQAKQDVPAFFQQFFTQALRVASVIVGLGAIGLSVAQLIGVVFLAVVYYHLHRNYPIGAFDSSLAREYFSLGLPLIIMGFCGSMIEYLDRVMLQYFANAEQVGYYAAGLGLSGFVKAIGTMVGILFFPLFSSAVSRNDFAYINRTIGKFERFTFIFIMPSVILLIIYSDTLVPLLLGNQFAPSASVMSITLLGMFIYVVNMPYGNLITGMSRMKLGAIAYVANLVFFVGLNAIILSLLPMSSRALGTGISVCGSAIALGLTFRVIVSRLTKEVGVWKYIKYMGFGIALWGVGETCAQALHIRNSIIAALTYPFVFVGLVYAFLYMIGWIARDDLKLFRDTLNVKKIGVYMRDELSRGKI